MKTLKGLIATLVSLLLILIILGFRLITWFWDASPPEIEISEIERRI